MECEDLSAGILERERARNTAYRDIGDGRIREDPFVEERRTGCEIEACGEVIGLCDESCFRPGDRHSVRWCGRGRNGMRAGAKGPCQHRSNRYS